jgi:hypothetical protein
VGTTSNGFPPLGIPRPTAGTISHSWIPFVLPYLEQDALYRQYRLDVIWADSANRPNVTQNQIKIMQCPLAKPNRMHIEAFPAERNNTPWGGCIDYAAIKGIRLGAGQLSTSGLIDPVGNGEGVMPDSAMKRILDIVDGTSNTILIAECAGRPEIWRAGKQVTLASLDPSMPRYPIEDAAGGDMPGGAWAEQQNAFFLDGSTPDGRLKPGPCAVNCTNNFCGLPTRNYDDGEVYSFHTGGAHCLLADGSVHFIRESINIRVFARLVTRADGEVVSPGDF